jgi:hypothetical protein
MGVLPCGAQEGRAAPAAVGGPAEQAAPVYCRLALDGAMFNGGDPRMAREIVLDLERIGDTCGEVYGISRCNGIATTRGPSRASSRAVTPEATSSPVR